MKRLFAIISLAIIGYVSAESASEDFPNESWMSLVEATSRAQQVKLADDDNTTTTCSSVYSCHDCHTARICRPTSNGAFQLLQTIKCGGDRPFCNPSTGSCVAEEPESCGAKDDFICMGNGKFPDMSCNRFHACVDYQSVTFECAVQGENFNPVTQKCEPSTECGKFDCSGNLGRKVPLSNHGGYFAFCKEDNGPLVIDSCPGNYELNVTSQVCEPACKNEGIVQDITDCHYYYRCTHVFVSRAISYMKKDRLMCPTGQAYSNQEFLCVDEKNVPNCQGK